MVLLLEEKAGLEEALEEVWYELVVQIGPEDPTEVPVVDLFPVILVAFVQVVHQRFLSRR